MLSVPGTQGYKTSKTAFVDTCQALCFHQVCRDFLAFLPTAPARILDAGAGAGQNAAALADMGHTVVAIEPLGPFLAAARDSYPQPNITWLKDSLPLLDRLNREQGKFEFILVEAVWHHLNEAERTRALERLADLLKQGGRCAISLRNGPAGKGTLVYPIDTETTVEQAKRTGLKCIFLSENLPSYLPNKENVNWARLVLQKR